jgi:hypothetical protein
MKEIKGVKTKCKYWHPKEKCRVCGIIICRICDWFATTLKVCSSWNRKEKFDFDKHCSDELLGHICKKCFKKL